MRAVMGQPISNQNKTTVSTTSGREPNDLNDEPIRNLKEFEAFVFSQSEETQRALGKIIAFILHCAREQ